VWQLHFDTEVWLHVQTVQTVGNCTDCRKLNRFQGTVQTAGNCTDCRELYRFQGIVQTAGNCTDCRKLYRLQGTVSDFREPYRLQETVQTAGNCTDCRELYRLQGTVQTAGNCTDFREPYRLQETVQTTGNCTETVTLAKPKPILNCHRLWKNSYALSKLTENILHIAVMNQHDAIFFTSFRYHATTCFGLIFSPSLGGQVYVAMVLLLLLQRLSAGLTASCWCIVQT
jgi:hypothetical protein